MPVSPFALWYFEDDVIRSEGSTCQSNSSFRITIDTPLKDTPLQKHGFEKITGIRANYTPPSDYTPLRF